MTKVAATIPAATEPSAEKTELTAEQEQAAEVKALLKRYGLPRAIVEIKTGTVTFDADLIERYLERDAEAYTEIKA